MTTMSVECIVRGLWYNFGGADEGWATTPTLVSTPTFHYGDVIDDATFHAEFQPPSSPPDGQAYGGGMFTFSFEYWRVATQSYQFSHGGTRNSNVASDDWTSGGGHTSGGCGWWKITASRLTTVSPYILDNASFYLFPEEVKGAEAVITAESLPRTVAKMRLDTSPDGGSPSDGGGP